MADEGTFTALRGFVLTSGMRLWASAVVAEALGEAFEEHHDRIAWTDPAVPLDTCIRWAWTDVAWYFADMTSQLGDSRAFLAGAGEAPPEYTGPALTRDLHDLRCLLALAAAVHDAGRNRHEDPYALTTSFTVAVLLGLTRAWPDRLEALGPYMADDLLDTLVTWAGDPAGLAVWTVAPPARPIPLPKRTMLVARAAAALEGSYDAYFTHLATRAGHED